MQGTNIFSLSLTVFKRLLLQLCKKLSSCSKSKSFTKQYRLLATVTEMTSEMTPTMGKGGNATNKRFSCSYYVSYLSETKFVFRANFNPLPNDNLLGWSKSKAFADDKINVT